MLETMREQTGSFIIWILFAIIIAAFVLFFGSPSDSLGCGSSNEFALEVEDESVSVHSWRFAYNGIPFVYGSVSGDQRRPLALEFLLQREILAQAAAKMDFQVSDKLVDEAIAAGDFYLLGNKVDGTKVYFENTEEEGFFFNYEYLSNLAKGRLGLPNVAAYKEEQRRELLAHLMKQEFLRSAYVSKEEAQETFKQTNTTISAKYVKFDTNAYRSAIKLTEAQVNEHMAKHEDDLKKEWEQVKPRWESDKARVRARIIKVAKTLPNIPTPDLDPDTEATDKTTDKTTDSEADSEAAKEAPVEVEEEIAVPDEARIAIDAAREKLLADADFATLATEVSEDRTASLGGQIGWRSADSMGYGQEVVDGSKSVEVGKISEVIESRGFYFLVLIEERNEKGLSFEQKKFDLAVRAAPTQLADQLAKAAATAALLSAQTTPLAELFSEAPKAPSFDPSNLPPEVLQQFTPEQLKQLMESMPQGETGAIVTEGPMQYAQLGDAPTAVPTAKQVAINPDTNDATTPATPSVPAPSLQSIQGTTRNGDFIAGLGRSRELVADLFGQLGVGDLGSKIYKVTDGDGYVVVQLTDRNLADMEKFAEEAAGLQAVLAEAKGGQRMQAWILERCESLKKSGAIVINPAMLRGSNETQLAYEPCSLMTQGQ